VNLRSIAEVKTDVMAKVTRQQKNYSPKEHFPVVGVGASAGGLQAFKKLIKAIPLNSEMAYILVQHLHPEHASSLPEILQRETSLPVIEIKNRVTVKPNTIYIIPVNKMLVARDGELQLRQRPANKKNMLIDVFFESLAEVHKHKAIGIVLSGTGSDGTAGLKRIREEGGITMAQNSASAAYEDMPEHAVKSDVVDFVLNPEDMPRRLLEIASSYDNFSVDGDSTGEKKDDEQNFHQILSLLRTAYAVDFNFYKQTTIRRRLLRRMAILNIEKISDYLAYLKANRSELATLFQDFLIQVTSFFREDKTFESICRTVFAEVTKNKSIANPLRIWVAGCATGEEAYSMAIYINEFLSDKLQTVKAQIFATDISEIAIAKARTGVYSKRHLENVSDARIQQFFTKTDGNYQVKKIIRDMCIFANHNFLKDPPFARMDLISCRNVLIYMEPFLQKKAFSIFHYALNEKGFLLLGKSETTGTNSDLFQPFGSPTDKLFSRKPVAARFIHAATQTKEERYRNADASMRSDEKKTEDFEKNADDILLSMYTPAGVIVNSQFDIVQFRGSTGSFLEPAPGKASLNVLRMAKGSLSFEIRNALHKATISGSVVRKERIPVENTKDNVTIEVVPLQNTVEPYYLILFETVNKSSDDFFGPAAKDKKEPKDKIKDLKNARILQLENDLELARKDMRAITEDQEAANEELQSANEQLLSNTEELQSLNEELETSKEELQSTNEELVIVNQELFDRNEQYNRARMYAEGIVTTIHEPLLVLNSNFSIKSANTAFYNQFSLTEKETLGKVIFELSGNGWNIPGFHEQLLKIARNKEVILEWEISHTFPVVGQRTICFNAQPLAEENGQSSILLAIDDVTLRREAEKTQSTHSLRRILESMPQITFSATPSGIFNYFNNFFVEYTGIPLEKALMNKWLPAIHPAQSRKAQTAWKHSIATLENFYYEFQMERKSDGMYRWQICRATAIINDNGSVESWVGTITDIHDKMMEEKAKDEFVDIVSRELRTPIATAKAFLQLLEHNMQEKNNPDLVYTQRAQLSINKLNNLVSKLLDINKIQRGRLGMHISTFNFNKMLAAAVEVIQLMAKNHTILLSTKVQKKIKGDEERLQQVVVSLLNNAVKYSPAGSKIYLNAAIEKGELKVSVRDNGIGIHKKNLNKIFERYYREKRTEETHLSGLGIGLSISKEIILRHNGKIWAESELGKGSVFYFTIPV
jgi:two-component system, chemotaxis family, CheB/CheR fusion protein